MESQKDTTKTLTLPNTDNDDDSIVTVNNITKVGASSNPISNIIAKPAASLLEINAQTEESPRLDIKKVK